MDNRIKDFKNLTIWQKSVGLVTKIYKKTKLLPKDELYELTSQIRRASVSIPTNISEGCTQRHTNEYIHFLYIALSSYAELETLLIIVNNLEFISSHELNLLLTDLIEVKKMLNTTIRSLKRRSSDDREKTTHCSLSTNY